MVRDLKSRLKRPSGKLLNLKDNQDSTKIIKQTYKKNKKAIANAHTICNEKSDLARKVLHLIST